MKGMDYPGNIYLLSNGLVIWEMICKRDWIPLQDDFGKNDD
jgi:hypothetical protein